MCIVGIGPIVTVVPMLVVDPSSSRSGEEAENGIEPETVEARTTTLVRARDR